jgi:hypothetical protein
VRFEMIFDVNPEGCEDERKEKKMDLKMDLMWYLTIV